MLGRQREVRLGVTESRIIRSCGCAGSSRGGGKSGFAMQSPIGYAGPKTLEACAAIAVERRRFRKSRVA